MKTFKEMAVTESNAGLMKNIKEDTAKLESIVRRYAKNGFMVKLMEKNGLGNFSKEGEEISKLVEEALAALEGNFTYPVSMDGND